MLLSINETVIHCKEKEMLRLSSSGAHCEECTLVTNKRAACRKVFAGIIKTVRDSVSKAQLLVSLHFWIPETSAR